MKIKAAEDLRGELVLSSVGKSLRAGKEIVITEESFWNDDIQMMLKTRKIAVVEGGENYPDVANIVEERITIQSAYRKPVEITSLPFPIRPGQVYRITRRQFDTPAVQQAIEYGLIVPVEADAQAFDPVAESADEIIEGLKTNQELLKRPDLLKDIDMEKLDEAEKFKLLGHAKTLSRDLPKNPKDSYIYDPHNTRAQKPNTPPNAHTYDPNETKVARPSSKLPVRGAIQPVGMTKSPLQEAQLRHAQASQNEQPAPRRIAQQAGPKRIRPVGGSGGGFDGDADLTCEII